MGDHETVDGMICRLIERISSLTHQLDEKDTAIKVIRKPKMPIIYETSPDGDKMDPECVPICNALNLLEGIETISSCCGHGFQPFRIYFVAEFLNDLKPIMELIDESEFGV